MFFSYDKAAWLATEDYYVYFKINCAFSIDGDTSKINKACFVKIRDLKRLRWYLTQDAALMVANALVGS